MKKRAAVLIGVKKTGGSFPELKATDSGVHIMAEWARSQGFDRVELITDNHGQEVRAWQITERIRNLVDPGDLDQLLVYFSGHGLFHGASEYWLLSHGVDETNEAVNVAGSEVLARRCPVPHVVLISDACRTPPKGITESAVTGSEIFPNRDAPDRRDVDIFYATVLGKPAFEVKDRDQATGLYRALYTEVLGSCLNGKHPELVEVVNENGGTSRVVRPRRLRDGLGAKVQQRLQELGLDLKYSQEPWARVNSAPEAWLTHLTGPPPTRTRRMRRASRGPLAPSGVRVDLTPLQAARAASTRALGMALTAGAGKIESELAATRRDFAASAPFAEAVVRSARTLGPTHFDIRCGFKVEGAGVAEAWARRAKVELLDETLVRVDLYGHPDDIFLRFSSGRAAILPAIPQFLTSLFFDEDELARVVYEPSEGSSRWHEFIRQAPELRMLRALIVEATRSGIFELEGGEALALTDRIRMAKGNDPALAIYAAYAYHALQREDLVRDMSYYLQHDLGFLPYDLALLAGEITRRPLGGGEFVRPLFPLLAQGWPLLRVLGGRLPPSLNTLQAHLAPSLWSLFEERGADLILDFMKEGN